MHIQNVSVVHVLTLQSARALGELSATEPAQSLPTKIQQLPVVTYEGSRLAHTGSVLCSKLGRLWPCAWSPNRVQMWISCCRRHDNFTVNRSEHRRA